MSVSLQVHLTVWPSSGTAQLSVITPVHVSLWLSILILLEEAEQKFLVPVWLNPTE